VPITASTFSARQDQEGTASEAYAAHQGLGGSVRLPTRTLQVYVRNTGHTISIRRQSAAVWVAAGEYMGELAGD